MDPIIHLKRSLIEGFSGKLLGLADMGKVYVHIVQIYLKGWDRQTGSHYSMYLTGCAAVLARQAQPEETRQRTVFHQSNRLTV